MLKFVGIRCQELVSHRLVLQYTGKIKKTLRIECASVTVRNHLLEQVRKRKPVGIYLSEFLPREKLSLLHRVKDLKREFPDKIRAVYIRQGDILFCRKEPDGDVIRVSDAENIDDLRSQFTESHTTVDDNGDSTA